MTAVRHYSRMHPPSASESRAIREFVESCMNAATVLVPFEYYETADRCTVDWAGGQVGGVAFHRLVRAEQLNVLHIVGTFVAPASARKTFVPMLLQLDAIERCLELGDLYWCFRTRNPLTHRAVARYSDTLASTHCEATKRRIAAACYGQAAHFDPTTGCLRGSYSADSQFVVPPRGIRFRGISHSGNECRLFCGPIVVDRALHYLRRSMAA